MKKPTTNFIIISSALVLGAIAGGLASIAASSYLGQNLQSVLDSKEVDIANSVYDRANLVIRDAKKVVVNQDVKIEETASSLQPVLVSAFKNNTKSYYALESADAFGLILSNDGWVLLNGLKEANTQEVIKNYSVISNDKKVYSLDKAFSVKITGDGFVYLVHLKDAVNLPVRQMTGAYNLKPGTSVILLSADGQTLLSSIITKKRPNILLHSDNPDVHLELANSISDEFKNALVFNLGGDFVGWVDGNKAVRPNYTFLPAWRAFIANSKSVFPSLGVNYLNLSVVKSPTLKVDKGAWLKGDDKNPAIIIGSIADKAGLIEGDVITRINNQELDQNNDLAETISSYMAGENISLTYDRAGIINEVDVTLGEAK
jgi:PDZ domain